MVQPIRPAMSSAGIISSNRLAVVFSLAIVAGLGAMLLRKFLFGSKALLFLDIGSDTYYSYYAYYFMLAQYLADLRLPFWSFQLGAGTSVASMFQFLYDPFSLVYFVAGAHKIATLVAWIFFLKIVVSAGCMLAYTRYLQLSPQVSSVASLMWAFNGFLMLWGQHFFFGSWVAFLPLFFLGVERYWQERRWGLLVLSAAFYVLNLAIFVQVIVFMAFYLLARSAWEYPRIGIGGCMKRVLGCAALVAAGMSLSAVLWLPEYYVLSSSPRIASDPLQRLLVVVRALFVPNESDYYVSMVNRIFSNNFEGLGSAYKGFKNYYESLQLYAGLLPLLIIPQAWSVLAGHERRLVLGGVGLILAALASSGFSMMMNGLQYPSYRWGYGVIFLEIGLTAFLLQRMLRTGRMNMPLLGGAVVVLAVAMAWLHDVNELPLEALLCLLGLLAAQALVLWAWVALRWRQLSYALTVGILCYAFFIEHGPTFIQRSTQHKDFQARGESPFFDDGLRAVQKIHSQDRGFFRIEKNHWILSLNDSVVQGYFGVDTYNSLNTPAYMDVVRQFGISKRLTVVQWNSLVHPYLADVLAVKYHLTKDSANVPRGAVLQGHAGDVEIFERRSALPFGFTYDAYISKPLLEQLTVTERERALLQAAVVDEKDQGGLTVLDRLAPTMAEDEVRQARRETVLELVEMEEDKLVGEIRLNAPRLLFLPIPYDRGWSASVNGESAKIVRVNYGFMGIHLGAGQHQVTLRFVPPLMTTGLILSIISLLLIAGMHARKLIRLPLKTKE